MKMGRVWAVGSVAAVLALAGCSSSSKAKDDGAAMSVNKTCPIMGGDVDQGIATTYKGDKVAFCCDGCETKFSKMTDAQKDAALAKAK